MITWILVANAGGAKLFKAENLRTDKLELIKEISHLDGLKKTSELVSDKPGHYQTGAHSRGVYENANPKEVETNAFIMKLIQELKSGYNENKYKNLIIVASARFYSLMEKHFHNHNIPKPTHIPKDYAHYTLAKLSSNLKKHLLWEYKEA